MPGQMLKTRNEPYMPSACKTLRFEETSLLGWVCPSKEGIHAMLHGSFDFF